MDSSASGNPNPEAVVGQIKAHLAQAYAQEFLEVRSLLISSPCVPFINAKLYG
jgi:hypothetical protein